MNESQNLSPDFIDSLKAQDKAAFNRLAQKSHCRLLGFATSMVGKELAEDVMQDAWVAIWRGLPKFAGRAALTTWLYTIIRNECVARLKRERRDDSFVQRAAGEPVRDNWLDSHFNEHGRWTNTPADWNMHSPEAALEATQLAECLEQHIEELQSAQQAVFKLRDIEQLDFEEICNILELSHSNARVLLHRARLQLFQVIDNYQKTGNCQDSQS